MWTTVTTRAVLQRLDDLEKELDHLHAHLTQLGARIMASLDDILAEVAAESSKIDSLSTLLDGVEAQLKAALAGSGISAEAQGKIDTIFANLQTNAGKIDAAISKNTSTSASTGTTSGTSTSPPTSSTNSASQPSGGAPSSSGS